MVKNRDPLTWLAVLVLAAVAAPCAAVAVRVVDTHRRRGSSVTTMEPTTTFNICPSCDTPGGDPTPPGKRWPRVFEWPEGARQDAIERHNCAVLIGPAGYWSVPAELAVGDVLAAIGMPGMVSP